jgi:hypothetical protein
MVTRSGNLDSTKYSAIGVSAVRGLTQDIGQWVGSVAEVGPSVSDDTLHVARVFKKDSWILVAVSLFTVQAAPIYTLLVSKGGTPSS